jgi:hypothetical protein
MLQNARNTSNAMLRQPAKSGRQSTAGRGVAGRGKVWHGAVWRNDRGSWVIPGGPFLSTYTENTTMQLLSIEQLRANGKLRQEVYATLRAQQNTIDRARAEMIELHDAAVARAKRETNAAK